MDTTETLGAAAERTWLDGWTAGPVEAEGTGLAQGARAPDVVLPDETGAPRRLSEFWAEGPALLMFRRLVRLPYVDPYCEAFPEPGVLVAAARLSRHVTETGLYATS